MSNRCLAKPFAYLSVRTFRWVRSPVATELKFCSSQDKLVVSDRNQIHINLNKTGNVWLINPRAKLSNQAEGGAQVQQGSRVHGPRDHSTARACASRVLISVFAWISVPFFFPVDQLIPEAAKSS